MGAPDLNAPDPGAEPQEENLTPDELLAKYGRDLSPAAIREELLQAMVRDHMLGIASGRKAKADQDAFAAWQDAYIKRYGTDEG